MTKIAADLRARAVNGEDPDKLQIEAYTEAGLPGTSSQHEDGKGAPRHAASAT